MRYNKVLLKETHLWCGRFRIEVSGGDVRCCHFPRCIVDTSSLSETTTVDTTRPA